MRAWLPPPALLLLCLWLPWAAQAAQVRAYRSAPGRLSRSQTPQFILISHDDNTDSDASRYVMDAISSSRNPNGCKLPVTWFTCTRSCGSVCSTIRSLYQQGHEIGAHTASHEDMSGWSASSIRREIVGSRDEIAKCGVPSSAIKGFRAPYLASSRNMRKALNDAGFRYDSSLGISGRRNRLWPASLASGIPYDCGETGYQCSSSERYSGLWEVPLVSDSKSNFMDYCTNENNGRPKPGCSAYTQLKKMFDDSYRSNRSPVTVAVHSTSTGYLQNSKYRSDVKRFLRYALGKGTDVWVVTYQQLLDWMQSPVPASGMTSFMRRYTCP